MRSKEMTFIGVPVTFTHAKAKFTAMEIKVLTFIFEQNPKVFISFINSGIIKAECATDKLKSALNRIGVKDDYFTFTFSVETLPIAKDEYKEFHNTLIGLLNKDVLVPNKIATGIEYAKINILDSVLVSSDKKEITIEITKEVFNVLFSLEFGLVSIVPRVVCRAKNIYTQRIYLILSEFSAKGNAGIDITALQELLGTETSSVEQFIFSVLKPAKDELDDLYSKGYSNLRFDYGISKSNSDNNVIFTIYS